MRFALLLGAAPLLAAELPVAPRTPTLSGTLDERFLQGGTTPAAFEADQDGLQETWSLFPGLPLPVELGTSEGVFGASAQGNAWAGPSLADSLSTEREPGLGGQPWLRLHQADAFPDTPSTRIVFWRGAVGAYRFGMDLERRLGSSVGLRLATQSRAYPSRKWKYRDQINSIYVGSDGRTLEDLPTRGTTPGLDEMRWEIALSTPLPGGALEGGWRLSDAARGWADPADTASLPATGSESRQEAFLAGTARKGGLKFDGGASLAGLDLSRPVWTLDTSAGRKARFEGLEARGRLQADWLGDGWSAGPRWLALWQDGDADGSTPWNADLRRFGADMRIGDTSGGHLHAAAGWTHGTVQGAALDLEDWTGSAGWTHRLLALEIGTSRWHRVPLLTESALGTIEERWLPSAGLAPERTDLHEVSARLSPWSVLSLDAGLALLSLDNRLAPQGLAVSNGTYTDTAALTLSNLPGTSQGLGWRAGMRLAAGGWTLRSEASVARLESPSGKTDLSLPQTWTRTYLDWHGTVLAGHMLLNARLGMKTRSACWAWISTLDGNAARVRLPAAKRIDLETRFEIGRFGLYWNLQNLGDQATEPAPGWSALGVRSGFGIQWSLAG